MASAASGADVPPVLDQDKPPDSALSSSLADMSDTRKVNAVYYPNYRVYRGETPATLNYECIDRVYYAFANLNSDGHVSVSCICL